VTWTTSKASNLLKDVAGPADILSLLRTVREKAETLMIVGHNPGLEELVSQLTGEQQDLPTAALAWVITPT
jgi:phosphohistidine phosphatase